MGHHGLLFKLGHKAFIVNLHGTETGDVVPLGRVGADDGDVGLLLDMEVEHRPEVHLVDAVAA